MNTLVIGDIHGNDDALMDVLRRAGVLTKTDRKRKDWRVISVGDMANLGDSPEFRGFISYDLRTLELAEKYVDVITVGNHEVYWTHHLNIGQWYGMAKTLPPDLAYQIYKMVGHNFGRDGIYQAAAEAHGWLITHAGLHSAFQQENHYATAQGAAGYLNKLLAGRAQGIAAPCYEIDGDNGIFWMRPGRAHKWEDTPRVKQIVGHTPDKKHPWYNPDTKILYIDNGGYFATAAHGSGVLYDPDNDIWEAVP